jgi:exodeoxyribonuclease V gamma subunit
MHAHGHPLLAAWGRQGRDFVRQLDAFDDVQAARSASRCRGWTCSTTPRHRPCCSRCRPRIRDLVPLAEHAARGAGRAADRSIVFHLAHSAQREVEILHDQLLDLLANPPGGRP